MFPFTTFFGSFSPFFLRKNRHQLSLGRGIGYYFTLWGWVILLGIIASIIALQIWVTPQRISEWSAHIPEFSMTIQDGILMETGLPEDPFELINTSEFIVYVSRMETEIPVEKQNRVGLFILKDKIIVSEAETVGRKEQTIKYSEMWEVSNIHLDKKVLTEKIMTHLGEIKKWLSIAVACMILFFGIWVALWYMAWSYFWGLLVWAFSQNKKIPLTYEESVVFVLSTFFQIFVLSILLIIWLGIWFPFLMSFLFLLMLGYNHLSFHTEPEETL